MIQERSKKENTFYGHGGQESYRPSWGADAQGRRGDAVFVENDERPFGETFAANPYLPVLARRLADTAQGLKPEGLLGFLRPD
jgi:hypothetical protein